MKRNYGQDVAGTARVGLRIMMVPEELQGTILEHADRLHNYARVHKDVVMLLIAMGRQLGPNAMDVGYVGEDSHLSV